MSFPKYEQEANNYPGSPGMLLKWLVEIRHEISEEEFNTLLINSFNLKKIDPFIAGMESLDLEGDAYSICDALADNLLNLVEVSIGTMMPFLVRIADSKKGFGPLYQFNSPIKKIAKLNHPLKNELEVELIKNHDININSFLYPLWEPQYENHPEVIIEKIITLLDSDRETLQIVGLRCLSFLKVISDENLAILKTKLERFLDHQNIDLATTATYSLCHLADKRAELIPLVELQFEIDSEKRDRIARYLSGKTGKLSQWEIKIFFKFTNPMPFHQPTVDSIDSICYFLLRDKQDDLVLEFLEKWINSNYTADFDTKKFFKAFDSTMVSISMEGKILNKVLLPWFNSDSKPFNFIIAKLLQDIQIRQGKCPGFEKAQVNNLNFDDTMFILRRVLAHVMDCEFSATLIISLIPSNSDPKIEKLIYSALVEQVGYNYPKSLLTFLETINTDDQSRTSAVVKKTISRMKDYIAVLEKVIPIPELYPNPEDALNLLKADERLKHKAMKQGREGSIASLFKNAQLKEGRRWFGFRDGRYDDPSGLSHISASYELPAQDVLDEVGAQMDRLGFRIARRGEK